MFVSFVFYHSYLNIYSHFIIRHANERKVKGIDLIDSNIIDENNDAFENIPSDNESDEGSVFIKQLIASILV